MNRLGTLPLRHVATLLTTAVSMLWLSAAHADTNKPNLDGVWIGVTVAGRTGPAWPTEKLTPTAKQAIDAFEQMYGPDVPEAGSYCVHSGMPSMMTSSAGYPIEIISNGKQINMSVETGSFRRIFLDGRAFPTDRPPTASGYSIGRWEGEVLVVETRGLAERVDSRFISDEARIIERIYLKDDTGERTGGFSDLMETERGGKVLVDEITVIDPKFYVEPIKFVANFRRAPDSSVLEYDCGREFWEAALEEKAAAKRQ